MKPSLRYTGIAWCVITVALFSACARPMPPSTTASPTPITEVPADRALLLVFNASGWTAFGNSTYTVSDSGHPLVRIPRNTYATVLVNPGAHDLRMQQRRLHVQAEAGHRYYVMFAYKPARSWAFPLAGSPMVLAEVPEDKAREAIAQFTYLAQ